MSQFEIWKLLTDVLLVGSLAFLCFRFLTHGATNASAQAAELETSLRMILKEAESASALLNEQLSRRQQTLEKLLLEFQGAEERMRSALESSRQVRAEGSDASTSSAPRRAQPTVEPIPEPPTFDVVRPPDLTPRAVPPVRGRAVERALGLQGEGAAIPRNIYGQPIAAAEPQAAASAYRPLRESIVQEAAPSPAESGVESGAGLDEVYSAAEDLLRAGQSLEQVSTRTKLSLDEVRMLSQMLSRERAARAAQDGDADRLV